MGAFLFYIRSAAKKFVSIWFDQIVIWIGENEKKYYIIKEVICNCTKVCRKIPVKIIFIFIFQSSLFLGLYTSNNATSVCCFFPNNRIGPNP